jgi:hypothetical protein
MLMAIAEALSEYVLELGFVNSTKNAAAASATLWTPAELTRCSGS